MRRFFRTHPRVLCAALLALLGALYFITQYIPLTYHIVHVPLDDAIPFVPAFIFAYILWYFYVPGLMLYASFREREVFLRQMAVLFFGTALGIVTFLLFPTQIDFRPDAAGEGLALALCRLIYANDRPVNVLPSLHCFEALAVYLPLLQRRHAHRLLCAVCGVLAALICLSTVFVRQHSVVDMAVGCLLAFALNAVAGRVLFGKKGRKIV